MITTESGTVPMVTVSVPTDDGGTVSMRASGLYVSVREAAQLVGVSQERVRQWVANRVDPIRTLPCGGNKTLVSLVALFDYARRFER